MPDNKLKAVVTADTTDYNKKMKSLASVSSKAAKMVVGGFTLAAAALAKYAMVVKNVTQTAEDYKISLIASFRDVDRGTKFYEKLTAVADKSAASTDDMMRAATRMANNLKPEELERWSDAMEDMAIVAGAKRMNIDEFASTIGEIVSKFDLGIQTSGKGSIDVDMWQRLSRVIGKEGVDSIRKMNVATLSAIELQDAIKKELQSTSRVIKDDYEKSITGLERKLGGVWEAALREAGMGQGAYKKLLGNVIGLITKMSESGMLDQMANSTERLVAEFAKLASDEGTIEFFKDLATVLSIVAFVLERIAKGFESFAITRSAVKNYNEGAKQKIAAKAMDRMKASGNFSKEEIYFARDELLGGGAGDKTRNRKFLEKSQLLESGSATTRARGTEEMKKIMKKTMEHNARTANTVDPQKEASKD